MHRQWTRAAGTAAVLSALFAAAPAQADYLGRSFWVPGQVAAYSALPANTGWTVTAQTYYTDGKIEASEGFGPNTQYEAEYETSAFAGQLGVNFAFRDLLAGGRISVGLVLGYASMDASFRFDPAAGAGVDYEDSSSGVTSVIPYTNIAWRDGNNNWMLYVAAGLPAGSFDQGRLANAGLGYFAADFGGGYTYLDRKSGTEVSLLLGTTYNGKNDDVDYQNGWNGHLDWSVSKFITPKLSLGVVGYGYWQYTEDQRGGEDNGVRSQVFALGPQATYVFRVDNREWSANLRGYWEFGGKDRPEGCAVFATLSMPFGN
jgi:hypothetical protein